MKFKTAIICLILYLVIHLLGTRKPKPVPGPEWNKPIDKTKWVLGYDYANEQWRYHSEWDNGPTQVIGLPQNSTLEELIMYDKEYYTDYE